jgi:Sodium/hydrogen exchanger family
LDALSSADAGMWAVVVFVAAVAGKIGGAVFSSRMSRQSWNDALALGVLLNTRGLLELVVLNVAYQAGVFSQTLFTLMVVVALGTTMLTNPLLNWLGVGKAEQEWAAFKTSVQQKYGPELAKALPPIRRVDVQLTGQPHFSMPSEWSGGIEFSNDFRFAIPASQH